MEGLSEETNKTEQRNEEKIIRAEQGIYLIPYRNFKVLSKKC